MVCAWFILNHNCENKIECQVFVTPMNRSMLLAEDDIAIMMLKLDYQQSSQYGPDPLLPPPVDPAILLAPCLTPCNAA